MKRAKMILSLAAVLLLCWGVVPVELLAAEKKIGVLWMGKSSMARRNYEGFSAQLRSLAPDVKIVLKKEITTVEHGATIFNQMAPTVDAMVVLRSSGAALLGTMDTKIPSFFGGASDPVKLGVLNNPDSPEGNITGVTYYVPYNWIFDVIMDCFPKLKSVGFLGEKGHPGTRIDQQGTKAECQKRGIKYYDAVCSDTEEVLHAAADLAKKADILLISNQALINRNVVTLLQITNRTDTPMVSYVENPVKVGAVLGISVDHVKLGMWLADSVYDVVYKGKSIKDVPVKREKSPQILVNRTMMELLKLDFPSKVMGKAKIIE